ncbi:kinase-like domain-containing protein [Xylariomycetidae sp. FL2044]|nr:kinase-like domain-containing protein [Xylariomycetidae sp. FL2044]
MAAPRPRPPPPPPARDDAGLAFRVRAPTAEASARNQSFRLARRGWREATKFIKMKTPFLKYERVLGYGGFGVVLLYTVLDAYGGPQKQVAIKFARAATNTNRREAFRLELDWLLKFKGAEHMVQLVDLPEMVLDPKEYNNNFPSYQILVMEFMSRADLYSLVMRLTDARDDNETLKEEDRKLEYIPVRILWRIFLCLVRACVGMAYLPPGNVPDRPPVGREEIPERGNERAIIHFDLDIYNVFMGSALLDDEHDVNPIAKLADFGLTKEWDDNDTTTYKEAKLLSGKRSFRTPEQQDNDDTAREPGRVSSALNIFAVGMVMYCLLTVHLPYDYLEKSETWPLETPDGSRYIETCAPAIVKTPSFWDFIDRRLRHLIARCMAKDPKLRPSLKELVDSIKERIEEANKMEQTLIDAEEAEERETGKKPEPVVINTSQPPTHPAPERLALLRRFYAEYINNVAADTAPDPYKDFWSQPSSASAPTLYSLDSFAQNTTAAAAALRPPVRRPPPPPPPPPRRPPPPPPRRTPFRPRTPPILPPAMTEMLSLVEQVFDTRHIAARDDLPPCGNLGSCYRTPARNRLPPWLSAPS